MTRSGGQLYSVWVVNNCGCRLIFWNLFLGTRNDFARTHAFQRRLRGRAGGQRSCEKPVRSNIKSHEGETYSCLNLSGETSQLVLALMSLEPSF